MQSNSKWYCIIVERSADSFLFRNDCVSSSLSLNSHVEIKHLRPCCRPRLPVSGTVSRALDLNTFPAEILACEQRLSCDISNPKTTQSPTVDTSGGKRISFSSRPSSALRSSFNLSEELIVFWGEGHSGDVTALTWPLQHFLSALHLFIMRSWKKDCWRIRQM